MTLKHIQQQEFQPFPWKEHAGNVHSKILFGGELQRQKDFLLENRNLWELLVEFPGLASLMAQ